MYKSSSIISTFHILLLLHQCLLFSTVKTEECIDVSNPKTRIFQSLVDLQTNNKTFDPRDEKNFEGNYVTFTKFQIDVIQKNAFLTQGSSHIEKLSLDNHGIRIIQDGAFLTLHCLKYLELQKNQISNISVRTFQGISKLHEMDLGENSIEEIPDRTFTFLIRLQKLNMAKNKLKILHSDSFFGLSSLEELDLSYNHLSDISPDTFQYFGRLTSLHLGKNRIEYLELDKSKNLLSLKILNLSYNILECFDTTYNYSFSSNLTELYLNGNCLTMINHYGFPKSLPHLTIIDLEDNPWNCSDLIPVVQVLNDSHISYKGLSHSESNVGGISCGRSFETCPKKNKTTRNYDIPTALDIPTTTTTTTTTEVPESHPQNKSAESQHLVDSDALDSIKHTQTIIVCLLVAIVIFIMADVAVRCGCLNFWINRRRHTFLDNADDDDGSLLRDRF